MVFLLVYFVISFFYLFVDEDFAGRERNSSCLPL